MEEKTFGYKLLAETVGIPIEIISNDYEEMPAMEDTVNTYQEIILGQPELVWSAFIIFQIIRNIFQLEL